MSDWKEALWDAVFDGWTTAASGANFTKRQINSRADEIASRHGPMFSEREVRGMLEEFASTCTVAWYRTDYGKRDDVINGILSRHTECVAGIKVKPDDTLPEGRAEMRSQHARVKAWCEHMGRKPVSRRYIQRTMERLGETVAQFDTDDTPTIKASEIEDLGKYREAGCKLAEAAMRVIRTYDGVHRLSEAVAEWNRTIANEGGRPHDKEHTLDREVGEPHDSAPWAEESAPWAKETSVLDRAIGELTNRLEAIEHRVLADGHSPNCEKRLRGQPGIAGARNVCTCRHDRIRKPDPGSRV